MDESTNRDTPTTTLRLAPAARERLRRMAEAHGLTQTVITNAAIMQFDVARYLRERAERAEQQAA